MAGEGLAALEAAILDGLIEVSDEGGRVSGSQVVEALLRFKGTSGVVQAMRTLANMGYVSWTKPGTGDIMVSDTPDSYPQCA